MAKIFDAAGESLLVRRVHRFVTLWKIERTDGEIFRFTDHDRPLDFEGHTYTPVAGFSASARQKETGLEAQNLEAIGVLSSEAITHDDLAAGKYSDAEVTEYLVDWGAPWIGAIQKQRYWITEARFSGEHWEAKVEGIARWLRQPVGDVYGRTCRYSLGDDNCSASLGVDETKGVIVQEVTSPYNARSYFTVSRSAPYWSDGDANHGTVRWVSGANSGKIYEVKTFVNKLDVPTRYIIRLQEPTLADIAANDEALLTVGCDKLMTTCRDKFDNLANFGGFPTIPGPDRMLQTPKAK
jgi:uncharacterized phage protein (TIGR02218 family)